MKAQKSFLIPCNRWELNANVVKCAVISYAIKFFEGHSFRGFHRLATNCKIGLH